MSYRSACSVVWFHPNSKKARGASADATVRVSWPELSAASRVTGPTDGAAHCTVTTWRAAASSASAGLDHSTSAACSSVSASRKRWAIGASKTEMPRLTTAGALPTSSAKAAASASDGRRR